MTDHEDAPSASDPHVRAETELADADLVLRARSGDTTAFGELWRRHYRSGIVVARNISPRTDADDLVQEAYTRIYQSIQRGGGPTGSFRAYLFTSIRNTAAGWGRSRHETPMEELEALEDPATSEQATADSLDRGLTHQAFRSLPSRWQEVLWYSEIEGMKPAEIAPLLGMKATAVAQLTFRAREGLREAWIQAHLRSVADDSDCAWTIARLGAYARNNIGRRDRARLEAHVASCARCAIVASEAREVSGRLALVLIPLTVGIAGTTGYIASLQGGGAPIVALAAMPSSVVQGAASAGSGLGVGAGSGTLAGAASTAGSGSGIAAGAGATSAAASAGTAVGTAAAGAGAAATATATVAATGVSVVAGGALTSVGVAGLAAATLVVAGTVAAAVALPSETDEKPSSVSAVSDAGTADASDTAADPASLGPAGPSPADIPVLPAVDAGGDGAADGTGAENAAGGSANAADADGGNGTGASGEQSNAGNGGTADGGTGHGTGDGGTGNGGSGNGGTGGSGNGGTGTTGNGGTGNGGTGAGTGNGGSTGNGGTGTTGNAGNGNTGGGGSVTGENNGTAQSGNANSGAGNNNGIGPAELPPGSPAIASSSSTTTDGQTTISLVATGEPGATVQARIRGVVRAAGTLGADGQTVLSVQPSAQDLSTDARLELRYVSGDVMGIPVSARLSALV